MTIDEPRASNEVVWAYTESSATAIVRPRGELDLYVIESVGHNIREAVAAGPIVVVIDLAEVTFMDSSALGLLVKLNEETRSRGQHLLLANVPTVVSRLFSVAGVEDRFEYVPRTGIKLCPICDHELSAGAKYGCPHCGARLE